jgi:hypothetical protein
MKAFKNRLEEMAEATVNALEKFIADEEYHISLLKKALKEYEDSDDEPKKCKSVTVII